MLPLTPTSVGRILGVAFFCLNKIRNNRLFVDSFHKNSNPRRYDNEIMLLRWGFATMRRFLERAQNKTSHVWSVSLLSCVCNLLELNCYTKKRRE